MISLPLHKKWSSKINCDNSSRRMLNFLFQLLIFSCEYPLLCMYGEGAMLAYIYVMLSKFTTLPLGTATLKSLFCLQEDCTSTQLIQYGILLPLKLDPGAWSNRASFFCLSQSVTSYDVTRNLPIATIGEPRESRQFTCNIGSACSGYLSFYKNSHPLKRVQSL